MRQNKVWWLLVVWWVGWAASAQGYDCEVQQLGWHFYCEEEEEAPETAHQPPQPANTAPSNARAQLEAIQEELEDLKAKAVLDPSPDNIRAYIAFQQQQLERASLFAQSWQRTIWQHPELDYTLKRPVSSVAKQAWLDERKQRTEAALASLPERYGVFFFFQGDCGYCHAYSPILKRFAERHGLHVMAVSIDGGRLPDWPDAVRDRGQAAAFGVKGQGVPATLLYDNHTQNVLPIGFGVLTEQQLAARIFTLTKMEVGDDF